MRSAGSSTGLPTGAHVKWLDKIRERHAARELVKATARADVEHAAAVKAWEVELADAVSAFDMVQRWKPGGTSSGPVLKKGEDMVAQLANAGLVEVKRSQGHYQAGYAGVSYNLGHGVRLRTGGVRGHYVPGDESETVTDWGIAHVTTHRITFAGARATREWKFENLVGHEFVGNQKFMWLELPVSNRQKTSGLAVDKANVVHVGRVLDLALALFSDNYDGLLAQTQAAVEAIRARRPERALQA